MKARKKKRRRRMLPASRWFWLLAPIAALSLLPIWLPAAAAIWWVALAMLALAFAFEWFARPAPQSLRVRRIFDSDYRVGRIAEYRIEVENTSRFRWRVTLRESLPPSVEANDVEEMLTVDARKTATVSVSFVPRERGPCPFADPTLRIQTPLGLFEVQEVPELQDEIVVLPGRPQADTDLLLARATVLEEIGSRVVRRRGHDSDFESLRDYVVGDDLRSVDWKATARRLRPQVRQFQIERNAEVILAVDCGRLMGTMVRGVAKLDLAIVSVLDLAAVATQRGERVGLLSFDASVLSYVPPRSGLKQLGRITDSLAQLRTEFRQTSYTRAVQHLETNQKKRSLLVLFTDFTDSMSSRELQHVLAALTKRHQILFVAVGDNQLEDIIAETPEQVSAIYQKAAAAELLVERQRIIEGLTRLGILAVDADPLRLTTPLLKGYFEARAGL